MWKFVSSVLVVLTCFSAGVYISTTKAYSNLYIKLASVQSLEDLGNVFKMSSSSNKGGSVLPKPAGIKDAIKLPQGLSNVKDKFKLPASVQNALPNFSNITDSFKLPIVGDYQKLFQIPGLGGIRDVFESPQCVQSSWHCFKTIRDYVKQATWGKLMKLPDIKLPNVFGWAKNNTVSNMVSAPFSNALGKVQTLIPKAPQLNMTGIMSSPLDLANKFQGLFSKPQSDTSGAKADGVSTTTAKSSFLGKFQNLLTTTSKSTTTTTTTTKPASGLFNGKLNIFKKNK